MNIHLKSDVMSFVDKHPVNIGYNKFWKRVIRMKNDKDL